MGTHIAVSGLIGAGKSTLVRGLSKELGCLALVERDEDNPYLKKFYEDPRRWAFQSFVFFVEQTSEDYRQARASPSGGVQERVLEEHLAVFGVEFRNCGYLQDADFGVLSSLTSSLAALVPVPDLLIHLEIDPVEALRRLRQRATAGEERVTLDYLESLAARYDDFLAAWPGELLRLDSAANDFRDKRRVARLASEVDARLVAAEVA